jgi:hypothetical protein
MRPTSEGLVAVAAAASLLVGCRAFDAGLLDGSTRSDAGACGRVPPARVNTVDDPSGERLTFVLGDPVLDQRDDRWATIGFDLDGLCSDGTEMSVRCRAPSSSAPPSTDGEEGIDNAFGDSILPLIIVARPDFEERAVTGYRRGLGAFVVRLDDWNGEPDDPAVRVAIVQTIFGSGDMLDVVGEIEIGADSLVVGGVTHPYPQWDGDDYFWGRPDNFLLGDLESPRIVDEEAYVAGGTLVVELPGRTPLILGGNETDVLITLIDAVLTVELDPEGPSTGRAVLAGRWAIADILAALAPAGVCEGTDDYASFERLLQLAADTYATAGAAGPCDAISVGLEFEPGVTANLVDAIMPFPAPMPCTSRDGGAGDGGVGDAGDAGDAGLTDGGST